MKFYRITNSLNIKIMGKIPQIKEVLYHCDVVNDPRFVSKIYFEKVSYNPIVANPILHSKANLVDLIEPFGMGSSFKILMSGKLKLIIENHRERGMQFFNNSVFHSKIEYKDYWLLNMYEDSNQFIDYKNCIIVHSKKTKDYEITYKTEKVVLKINNLEEFNGMRDLAKQNDESFNIVKLAILKHDENFFMLRNIEGGWGYFVSEKLKQEIEDAGCTGIEFQPSALSYDEWVVQDGPRDQIYGRSW